MSKIAILLASIALSSALAGAGCGGEGEGIPATQISSTAFVKRANAICARTYARIKTGYRSFVKSGEAKGFSQIGPIRKYANTVLIPAKRREVEELRALGAPSGDEDQVEAILAAYEEGIATAEEDPRFAVTSTFGAFVKATELAKEYGLDECRY